MTDSHGKKQFLLRISEDLHSKIKSAADESNISMSAWATKAVRDKLINDSAQRVVRDAQLEGEAKEVHARGRWWE